MADSTTALGLVAGLCTTCAFLPQVVRTWRTRSTLDISLGMYVIILTGTLLWLAYGIVRQDLPVVLANGVTAGLQCVILALKLKHG